MCWVQIVPLFWAHTKLNYLDKSARPGLQYSDGSYSNAEWCWVTRPIPHTEKPEFCLNILNPTQSLICSPISSLLISDIASFSACERETKTWWRFETYSSEQRYTSAGAKQCKTILLFAHSFRWCHQTLYNNSCGAKAMQLGNSGIWFCYRIPNFYFYNLPIIGISYKFVIHI